jgi:hypothetical protein
MWPAYRERSSEDDGGDDDDSDDTATVRQEVSADRQFKLGI